MCVARFEELGREYSRKEVRRTWKMGGIVLNCKRMGRVVLLIFTKAHSPPTALKSFLFTFSNDNILPGRVSSLLVFQSLFHARKELDSRAKTTTQFLFLSSFLTWVLQGFLPNLFSQN